MTRSTPTKRKPQATKSSLSALPGENPIVGIIAARGWPLFIWLVILSILSVISLIDGLIPFKVSGAIFGLLQVGLVAGLWFWRKWAFFAFIGVLLLVIVLVAVALLTTHRLNLVPLIVAVVAIVGTNEVVSRKLGQFH